jgi:phosphotriesterase-related protein
MDRRSFINRSALAVIASMFPFYNSGFTRSTKKGSIMTVKGEINARKMGFTLSHEHVLVDFTGAAQYDPSRWDDEEVVQVVTPYVEEIFKLGCRTLVECTPEYIGRDPLLLRDLSEKTGINILTNTGIYGAADNKYVPEYAYHESAQELSDRWVKEFQEGIGNTGIRPGFIKIGVVPGPLSELHKKLVTAAAVTHRKTGLAIASHTGPSVPAFEEIQVLRENGIDPSAFIWVHAQNEMDGALHTLAAGMGAWVSLDGLNDDNIVEYLTWLKNFKENKLLKRVLVSHDAGWYSPGEENGGDFRPFNSVFNRLIPAMQAEGFSQSEINTIFINNPAEAFSLQVRNL